MLKQEIIDDLEYLDNQCKLKVKFKRIALLSIGLNIAQYVYFIFN